MEGISAPAQGWMCGHSPPQPPRPARKRLLPRQSRSPHTSCPVWTGLSRCLCAGNFCRSSPGRKGVRPCCLSCHLTLAHTCFFVSLSFFLSLFLCLPPPSSLWVSCTGVSLAVGAGANADQGCGEGEEAHRAPARAGRGAGQAAEAVRVVLAALAGAAGASPPAGGEETGALPLCTHAQTPSHARSLQPRSRRGGPRRRPRAPCRRRQSAPSAKRPCAWRRFACGSARCAFDRKWTGSDSPR